MDYLIIGGSAAGIQASETLRKKDNKSNITLLSKEKDYPYSRCLISRFVDGRMSEDNFYFKSKHYFSDKDIKGYLDKDVSEIKRDEKKVLTSDGQEFLYDKLLIATGSSPWIPEVNGVGLKGVYTFHSLEDARKIKEHISSVKTAVVLGAGFIGLEAAYALSRNGIEVTVVEKSSQLLPKQLDPKASQIIESDFEGLGVRIIFDESVSSINGQDQVKSVTLLNRTEINCDMVIIAVGVKPNADLAKKAGLDVGKGIIVDDYFKTSDPEIYAAGDVIEINDVSTGKRDLSATWLNAILHGKYAAENMAGYRKRYTGAVGIQNAVQFHRIPVISFGKTLLESSDEFEDYEVMSITKGNIYKKLIIKADKICGMIFVNDIMKSGFYAALIRNSIDIGKFKDKLLDPDFSYAYFKDRRFGEYDPYFETHRCWEGQDWWANRLGCQMH
jgi:nitrite reductase (NADH) large subunit